MNLKSIGSNQTELTHSNNVVVLYSYSTPVAVFIPEKGGLCTTKKYSVTTTLHINKAITRWGCSRTEVDQSVIERYANHEQPRSYP